MTFSQAANLFLLKIAFAAFMLSIGCLAATAQCDGLPLLRRGSHTLAEIFREIFLIVIFMPKPRSCEINSNDKNGSSRNSPVELSGVRGPSAA